MHGHGKQVGFVGASNLEAAARFYGGVLGLELFDARPFALVHETPGSRLRVTIVDEVRAAPIRFSAGSSKTWTAKLTARRGRRDLQPLSGFGPRWSRHLECT